MQWLRRFFAGDSPQRPEFNPRSIHVTFVLPVKVKRSRYRPGMAQRVGRGIALLFHDRGTRRGEWSAVLPGRTLPPGKTRYPFYRRLGGPQGWSGRTEILVPTGIRSRAVQPVAESLYRLSYRALVELPLPKLSTNTDYSSIHPLKWLHTR